MVQRSRAVKLWVPYSGFRWPPPRLVQLAGVCWCWWRGHKWGNWRVETEDWYKEVSGPEPYAWRCCRRCEQIERVV